MEKGKWYCLERPFKRHLFSLMLLSGAQTLLEGHRQKSKPHGLVFVVFSQAFKAVRYQGWSPGSVRVRFPLCFLLLYLISAQTPPGSSLIPCCSLDIQGTSTVETWDNLFPSVSVLESGGVRDWNLWQTTTDIPATPPPLNLTLIATHLLTQWYHPKRIFSSPPSLSLCDVKIVMNGSTSDL